MSELGVETFHKVSGAVMVRFSSGANWVITYIANISDCGDTCEPEMPEYMNPQIWADMENAIMEACYADAYKQIREAAQADQMEAELADDPTAEELPVMVALRDMVDVARRVVDAWEGGGLAVEVMALEGVRLAAIKILDNKPEPEVDSIPLVVPDRLDISFLPPSHPDSPIGRIAKALNCTIGEAFVILAENELFVPVVPAKRSRKE